MRAAAAAKAPRRATPHPGALPARSRAPPRYAAAARRRSLRTTAAALRAVASLDEADCPPRMLLSPSRAARVAATQQVFRSIQVEGRGRFVSSTRRGRVYQADCDVSAQSQGGGGAWRLVAVPASPASGRRGGQTSLHTGTSPSSAPTSPPSQRRVCSAAALLTSPCPPASRATPPAAAPALSSPLPFSASPAARTPALGFSWQATPGVAGSGSGGGGGRGGRGGGGGGGGTPARSPAAGRPRGAGALSLAVLCLATGLARRAGRVRDATSASVATLLRRALRLGGRLRRPRAAAAGAAAAAAAAPALSLAALADCDAPALPAAAAAGGGQLLYRVREGETLWGIASRAYGDGREYPRLLAANPWLRAAVSEAGRGLQAGDLLALPEAALAAATARRGAPQPVA